MTKNKKITLILIVVSVLIIAFAGCQSFKWGPVGSTEFSDKTSYGNGGYAVRQGDYLYYVNGYYAQSNLSAPKDNYFGKASVKGSIMKSKVSEDGSLSETAIVVPKAISNTSTMGGIYVIGEWIYYATPTTLTDNTDTLLTTTFEYYRTKTDGTKTQKIDTVDSAALNFKFTDYGFIYYLSNTITMVQYDNNKIGDKTTVVENASTAIFTTSSEYTPGTSYLTDYIFYTKVSETDTFYGNILYATNGLNTITVASENAFKENPDINNQFSFTPLRCVMEGEDLVLYYTRSSYTGGSTQTVGTFGYKFNSEIKFDPTKEKKFSSTALSTFYPISFAEGLLDTSSASTKLYNGDITPTVYTFSAAPSILFKDGDFYYYLISNKLMRRNILADGQEIKVCDETMDTTWLTPCKIDNYLYYIDSNESSYLFRININDFVFTENNITFPEGKIVSGYSENENTEDGLAPSFMTETDLSTYETTHAKED